MRHALGPVERAAGFPSDARVLIANCDDLLPVTDHRFLDSFSLGIDGKPARYAEQLRNLPVGLTEWAVHPGLGKRGVAVRRSRRLARAPDRPRVPDLGASPRSRPAGGNSRDRLQNHPAGLVPSCQPAALDRLTSHHER